jgi:hypothetical protein
MNVMTIAGKPYDLDFRDTVSVLFIVVTLILGWQMGKIDADLNHAFIADQCEKLGFGVNTSALHVPVGVDTGLRSVTTTATTTTTVNRNPSGYVGQPSPRKVLGIPV